LKTKLESYLAKLETLEEELKFHGSGAWEWSISAVEVALGRKPREAFSQLQQVIDEKKAMVVELDKIKNLTDALFICEIGVGLDLLYASQIKEWKKVICYDRMPLQVGKGLQDLFDDLGIHTTIEYQQIQTPITDKRFEFRDVEITPIEGVIDSIHEDVILIWLWTTRKPTNWLDLCKMNPHIKGVI